MLAAVDFRQISSTVWKIAFDEYRYDALGRRVLVRSRRLCGGFVVECNQAYVRRTIWAGSQELYEIQMPDDDIVREYDTQALPTRAADGNGYDLNPMYGRVAYTFGLKLDQPLSVIRLGDMNSFSETWIPFSIVPLWTVRGTADTSYFAATGAKNCKATNHCVLVAYGSQYWTPAYSRYFVPTMFQGTLLTDKSDHTGQLYRRNRYYDPGTGRFTQEDPIGLAGGLNAYGFAGGDPVNFSDPFGLCPIEKDHIPCAVTMGVGGALAGAATGALIGAAGGTLVVPGVGTVAGGGGGAVAGGLAGLVAGTTVGAARDLSSAVEMSGLGKWIRRVLVGGAIYVGGGLPERVKGGDDAPEIEQPVKPPIPPKLPDPKKPDPEDPE